MFLSMQAYNWGDFDFCESYLLYEEYIISPSLGKNMANVGLAREGCGG